MLKEEMKIDIKYRLDNIISIGKTRTGKLDLDDIKRIDIQHYWIFKATKNNRLCTVEDLYSMKYCNFLLLDKNYYDLELINKNIEVLNGFGSGGGGAFTNKLLPGYILDKVEYIDLNTGIY